MSGRIIYVPPSAHDCEGRPSADWYKAGTIWECSECGKQYVVVEGAQYNESYSAWRDADKPTLQGEYRG